MKKQNLKSLTLKRNTISNLETVEINGGISGGACAGSQTACAPASVVHTCRYSDQRTCTYSVVYCAA